MSKTIQIRDVDDAVYEGLRKRAAEDGVSVPELLRSEVERIAARPTMREWLRRTDELPSAAVTTEETLAALDEWRGAWPDAGR